MEQQETKKIVSIRDGIAGNPQMRLAEPLNLEILAGEQLCICGDNASGKTRIAEIISGKCALQAEGAVYDFSPSQLRYASENIKTITFLDAYGEGVSNYYYQQRWNTQDIDEDTPTVGMLLEKAFNDAEERSSHLLSGVALAENSRKRVMLRDTIYERFGIKALLDEYIISISSGELRKFQLTKTLLSMPRVLVLDNPYIGLDAATRDSLSGLIGMLGKELDLNTVSVISRLDVIPDFLTHYLPVEGLKCLGKTETPPVFSRSYKTLSFEKAISMVKALPAKDIGEEKFYPQTAGAEIVKCSDINVRYGTRSILKDFNWTVYEGEKWALTGENGAGKSTLLSLICADNPQAYACDISLFGHKRGSGESIWEIKRHIGFVSPEMHRAYQRNIPALDIVASGLKDTVGLPTHAREEEEKICRYWMEVFGIEGLAQKPFLKISSGEQRLCLLTRAFVKDPELLILDEPLHGLDEKNSELVKSVIEAFVTRPHKTLIMVSHYENEFPECIDKQLYLNKNR